MIIERLESKESLYNDNIELNPVDMEILRSVIEEYGVSEAFDVLNEVHYGGEVSGDFDRSGGAQVKGVGGFVQSLPSFAISAMISWPLTVLMGIGAISRRIQKRWEDKTSWRKRLDPRFWAEFTANPHGHSIPHEVLSKPVEYAYKSGKKLVGGVKNAALKTLGVVTGGILGVKAADEISKKIKNAKEKQARGEELTDEDMLTPEDVKNMDFRPYWVAFTNGEVIRLRADSKESAKKIGEYILNVLVIGKTYDKMNEVMQRDRSYHKFVIPFDDGEVAEVVAKSTDEAIDLAKRQRTQLVDQLNKSFPDLIPLEPLSKPNPLVDQISERVGEKIDVPKIKTVYEQQPGQAKKEKKDKLPQIPYKTESLQHYRVQWTEFIFNMPALQPSQVVDIFKRMLSEGYDTFKRIEDRYNERKPLYKVSFADGDQYNIAEDTEAEAKEFALKLFEIKDKAVEFILQGGAANEYDNLKIEHKGMFNKIRSTIKNEKPEKHTLKDVKKLKISELTSPGEKLQYKTIEL